MAWDFAAQVHALSGFDGDSSDNTETVDTYQELTTQWLTDAVKEVTNVLPPYLQKLCAAMQVFTSKSIGSETEVLNTGKILSVFAGSYEARAITNNLKYRAIDSDSIEYATSTDPVYYIESNKINVLPNNLLCRYEEIQYASVAYDDSSISIFPDEAEYLVVLRAAITAAEYLLAIEEDTETYGPIILSLKQQYNEGIEAISSGQLTKSREREAE